MLEHSDDTLSANVVNLFPKRYQIFEDQQDEKKIFFKNTMRKLRSIAFQLCITLYSQK